MSYTQLLINSLIVAYCSSVNFAIINTTMSLYSIINRSEQEIARLVYRLSHCRESLDLQLID